MIENIRKIRDAIFRTFIYSVLYTTAFILLITLLRFISFYGYSVIDQYLLIIYMIGIIVISFWGKRYDIALGVFLLPVWLVVLYVSYWVTPRNIGQYTHVANCTKGDFYLEHSGPRNGNTYLIYQPGGKSIPADVDMREKEIQIHVGVSQYSAGCKFDTEYNVFEYTFSDPQWYSERGE